MPHAPAGGVMGSTLSHTGTTFTNYGTLSSNVGSGGARTVNGNLFNNYGIINVNAETTFNANVFNAGAIHLNEAATFRSLTGPGAMTGSGAKTFTGSSTLEKINTKTGDTTVAAEGHLTVGTINDGDVTVNGTLALTSSGGQSPASRLDSLAIGAAGKVDVGDNKVVITGPTASVAAVEAAIQSASNGGAWDGPSGITTSQADAVAGLTSIGVATAGQVGYAGSTFGGVSVAGDDVLVMYTYAGDANLDGLISGDDYSAIDFNILTPGTGGWINGDFNHDGLVSGDDYSAIDFNIIAQGAPFPTSAAASPGVGGVTPVPEPGCLSFLSLAGFGLTLRRRRRNIS
jgi:hypothetical protein